ncbi:MAG: hypothetical protein H7Z14_16835 [Anaerolineae bacterium]|nr:hypothetical protein [Phycisphaerae bacterium]
MRFAHRRSSHVAALFIATILLIIVGTGCTGTPRVVPLQQQKPIDRSLVEIPAGMALFLEVDGLTTPTSVCFDNEEGDHKGTVLIAEGGVGGTAVRILGLKPDRTISQIYPRGQSIALPFLQRGFRMYGPIGGMCVVGGRIIVSHRDADGMGVVTSFGYDGSHKTVIADLPAQGNYSVTDVALNPVNGRLYFGVGAATNSGVVGLDNWQAGWVRDHPLFHDTTYVALKLLGYRFDTKNPRAGLFGGADIAVTAPFQAFNSSTQTRILPALNGKPSAAIYSISPSGGDLRVEAHGVRLPRGLVFNEYGGLFFTNNGMEMRGTRPVKDDPDTLMRLAPGTPWYGWPDFSADLRPISESQFQPPMDLVIKTGYPELAALLDHKESKLDPPDIIQKQLLYCIFESQSGAAKLDIVPGVGPFKNMRGDWIVALSGDRSPFATSGQKLIGPMGYKIERVDVDKKQRSEFIRNTSGKPASWTGRGGVALERPCDVKFAADGTLYILDMGEMRVENGKEKVKAGSGRLFKLVPEEAATTRPTTQPTTR